jgi:hypothetical protein
MLLIKQRRIGALILILFLNLNQSAHALNENGHRAVGAIADELLIGTRAEREVYRILGEINAKPVKLESAAVWLDCARSVKPGKKFAYVPYKAEGSACEMFEEAAALSKLQDYVRRHNTRCKYIGVAFECHKSFHILNLPLDSIGYVPGGIGVTNSNIVEALRAAIGVLQGRQAPRPFDTLSPPEAVFLLAHLVGDIHQPLHVGSLHLKKDGSPANPANEAEALQMATKGGNSLFGPTGNLHSAWDGIRMRIDDDTFIDALAGEAERAVPTVGEVDSWPATWAGESLLLARAAYAPLTFGKHVTDHGWDATNTEWRPYMREMRNVQRRQIIVAGARLAEILKAIWP